MDLFRYFHPHHNPRLRKVAVRLQEIGELELAARELERAVKRARLRTGEFNQPESAEVEQFNIILGSLTEAIQSLNQLLHLHPGDSAEIIEHLIEERRNIPGWENWSRIVRERLNESLLEKRAVG